jgi:hypothetical protein
MASCETARLICRVRAFPPEAGIKHPQPSGWGICEKSEVRLGIRLDGSIPNLPVGVFTQALIAGANAKRTGAVLRRASHIGSYDMIAPSLVDSDSIATH